MTEIPLNLRVEYAEAGAPRCRHEIRLGARTYRCARNPHVCGIHDAKHVHGDGRPVRW